MVCAGAVEPGGYGGGGVDGSGGEGGGGGEDGARKRDDGDESADQAVEDGEGDGGGEGIREPSNHVKTYLLYSSRHNLKTVCEHDVVVVQEMIDS